MHRSNARRERSVQRHHVEERDLVASLVQLVEFGGEFPFPFSLLNSLRLRRRYSAVEC